MTARVLVGLALVLCSQAQAQTIFRAVDTSVILNVCVPELNGEGFLHVDEDVTGLEIEVVDADGVSVALYDATGEQEDVAAPGTGAWTTPSANNVRVGPDGRDVDCTELQFADGVFDDAEVRSVRISDAQATIMDVNVQVVFLGTSADVQADVVAGITTFGGATEANVNANETKIDTIDGNVDSILTATGVLQTTLDEDLPIHHSLDTVFLNCTVNTANFAGSTTTLACILTDNEGGAVTVASGDLTGLEVRITSGAQRHEGRFINTTTWDGANSELRITLSRALPATLADAVTAIIR